MSTHYVLRGGCQCGRNHYFVQPPPDAERVARILFESGPAHSSSFASPIPAFLRIPLAWYHSSTTPFFEDETPAMIHRVYEEPVSGGAAPLFSQRHFCGFCGTPLSFWSEAPHAEADYIRLVLGSLYADDLHQLDDWGAIGEARDEGGGEEEEEEDDNGAAAIVPSSTGLPWLDRFVEGSRLGRHLQLQRQLQGLQLQGRLLPSQPKTTSTTTTMAIRRHEGGGAAASADGTVQVEWEVLEWSDGDGDEPATPAHPSHPAAAAAAAAATATGMPSPAKRQKYDDGDGASSSGGGGSSMDVEPPSVV